MTSLRPEALTWTALLGRWIELAQVSLAIPADADGPRWRQSLPAIINLQAVTFALAELGQLAADERALGLDKAGLLIGRSSQELERIWGEQLPATVHEICRDARAALEAAQLPDRR
jgi:hypothetical protein